MGEKLTTNSFDWFDGSTSLTAGKLRTGNTNKHELFNRRERGGRREKFGHKKVQKNTREN